MTCMPAHAQTLKLIRYSSKLLAALSRGSPQLAEAEKRLKALDSSLGVTRCAAQKPATIARTVIATAERCSWYLRTVAFCTHHRRASTVLL